MSLKWYEVTVNGTRGEYTGTIRAASEEVIHKFYKEKWPHLKILRIVKL